MIVKKISPEDWKFFSEFAHESVFGKKKPVEMERIDFALLCVSDKEIPMGYITCRENDSETIYWQFGGVFPGTKDTILSFRVMQAMVRFCKEHYKRITYLVENTNTAMLKFAMRMGFKIQGVRYHNGSVLLEHVLEF